MTTAADLAIIHQAYDRHIVDFHTVRAAQARVMPHCGRCQAAAVGYFAEGELLCAECATDKVDGLSLRFGRFPTLAELREFTF